MPVVYASMIVIMAWEILFYVTPSGQRVVEDFIDNLDKQTRTKTARQIDLLEAYGTAVGMPHTKALGGGLLELRVRGKREVRIFYAYAVGKRIFMLHSFVKKTRATPKKELDIARKRQHEIDNL